MTDLFPDLPQQDSPRLAWMKRYGVKTTMTPEPVVGSVCDLTGEEVVEWYAYIQEGEQAQGGHTEDEAIAAFAKAQGMRLWNEEALP